MEISVKMEEDPPDKKPHICEICYEVLDSEDLLSNHRQTCSENKPHVCHLCCMVFKMESELTKHKLALHQQGNESTCATCGGFVEKEDELEKKPYLCDKCHLVFTDKGEFVMHTKSHEESSFTCSRCRMTFPLKETLHVHLEVCAKGNLPGSNTQEDNVQDRMPFVCAFCKLVFHKEESLSQHLQTHLNPSAVSEIPESDIKKEAALIGDIDIKCEKIEPDEDGYNESQLANSDDKVNSRHKYKCEVCGKTYVRRYDLNQHLLTHTGQNYHKCDQCDKTFNWLSNLNKHMKVHTGMKPYQCDKCTKSFARKAHLERHQIVHAEKELFPCEVCGRSYTRMKDLAYHKIKHTAQDQGQNACTICGKPYIRPQDLARHMTTTHGISGQDNSPMYQDMSLCNESRETVSGQPELNAHIGTGLEGSEQAICAVNEAPQNALETSSYDMLEKANLALDIPTSTTIHLKSEHSYIHQPKVEAGTIGDLTVKEEQETIKSETKRDENCFVFTDFKTFYIRVERIQEQEMFECAVCKAEFSDKSTLISHLQMHTKDQLVSVTDKSKLPQVKPYQCEQCKERFSKSTELAQHITARSCKKPIKPYQCDICGNYFGLEASFKQHMKLKHTGEKKHKCTLCDKAFVIKCELKLHMLKHTGEKPHQCTECDAAFTEKGNLKKHMLIHSEKAFKCSLCPLKFTQNWQRQKHMQTHTGVKPHQCHLCDKAYSRKDDLKIHLGLHAK